MSIEQTSGQINRDIAFKVSNTYNLKPILRLAYEAIRSFKDNSKHTAYPSVGTIANMLGVCRNSAKSYIRQLESKGILSVEERKAKSVKGNEYNDTNLYTFVVEKYGEARMNPRKTVRVVETSYQKAKREMQEAMNALSKKYSISLCEEALREAIKNIRSGATSFIRSPLKYIEAIIKAKLDQKETAKAQLEYTKSVYTKDDKVNEGSDKKNSPVSKPKYSGTKFHNFEQRTSKYSNAELEAIIRKKRE